MNPLNLPAAYVPFANLRIGDNRVKGAVALATVGGLAPFLIGQGELPHIWLTVPAQLPGAPWRELVVDNVSFQSGLIVEAHPKAVHVRLAQATLITAVRGAADALSVTVLDLRPVGLEIFLDARGLHVLGSTLTRNAVAGVPVVLAYPAS